MVDVTQFDASEVWEITITFDYEHFLNEKGDNEEDTEIND